MIGGFAIGARPVGTFRLIVSTAIIGAATVAFTLSGTAAGAVSTSGAAAAGFVLSGAASAGLSTSGSAAVGFVLAGFASGTVTNSVTTFDPSTRRNLIGGGARGLSAGGSRMTFGGGDRGRAGE